MCNYFSCIVTPDKKVHWSKTTNAHEILMEKLKIREQGEYVGLAVKIEVAPKTSKITRNQNDWNLKIDQSTPPPLWYNENLAEITNAIWSAWAESVQEQIAIENEQKTVDSIYMLVYGSATVDAYGSATVNAYGSARVNACGSATVNACDSARVNACDSATVNACGSATVNARGSATVNAYDSATVKIIGELVVVRKNDKLYVLPSTHVYHALEVT